MTALLEIDGVAKSFGAVRSLVDITFSVEDHSIVGLIGPNGAGKSTLINILTGVYAPDGGSVRFAGRILGRAGTAERARLGLVRTFQRPTPILDLSCIEGVMVGGLVRGLSVGKARSAALDILTSLGLREAADQSPRKLPTGHLKLLDFARVLMLAPRLVLLDELMAGLSFSELEVVLGTIERLADRGASFLVVEHLLDVIKRLSRRLVVMDAGIIVAAGEPNEVIRDPRVIEAYLGDETVATSAETGPAAISSSITVSNGEPVSARSKIARALPMLEVNDLVTGYDGVEVVHGVDLEVRDGETVCMLGANGAGKSTILRAIMRQLPCWRGSVRFLGEDITAWPTDVRGKAGIFLAFQDPESIGGVPVIQFLRQALSARKGIDMSVLEVRLLMMEWMDKLGMDPAFGERHLNDGFSGGEKKRNEILQMAMLEPELAILDETDSGLDVDALRTVARGVHTVREARPDLGVLVITHYQRMLDELAADHVHLLVDGVIVADGGPELAASLESEGYDAWRS